MAQPNISRPTSPTSWASLFYGGIGPRVTPFFKNFHCYKDGVGRVNAAVVHPRFWYIWEYFCRFLWFAPAQPNTSTIGDRWSLLWVIFMSSNFSGSGSQGQETLPFFIDFSAFTSSSDFGPVDVTRREVLLPGKGPSSTHQDLLPCFVSKSFPCDNLETAGTWEVCKVLTLVRNKCRNFDKTVIFQKSDSCWLCAGRNLDFDCRLPVWFWVKAHYR